MNGISTMARLTNPIHRVFNATLIVSMIVAAAPVVADPPRSEFLYSAHHPRLLFSAGDLPALYGKVRDGGADDEAYAVIRDAAVNLYPSYTMEELLGDDFGLNTVPNLGLAVFLESPEDDTARDLGRQVTLYIADNYDVDSDSYQSSLRLRSLALGYDMFMGKSPDAEREYLRGEIESYIDMMTNNFNYEIWRYRPYLGNKSTMIAASLGLAAICLDGETDPARVSTALDYADVLTGAWLTHQLDENGAYNEGLVYGSWSVRMLIYYFDARKSYDGADYSSVPRIRAMEKWFAYELLPEGSGRTNNLNDCAYKDYILSRHHTYFDWAQTEWGSGLSSWLWDHTAGDNGWDWGLEADKTATVLWHQSLPPLNPEAFLPKSVMWEDRGLYYYRSGWNMGPDSEDIVFSFYAGTFQGAHAQEDQGQFTLYGFGAKFAIDHGPGPNAKQSEAHNIVLVDDRGQHNAGSSIGTDGSNQGYLLSDFSDYVATDLSDAYTTHSRWNDPDVPFPGADWSWGYDGGNAVNLATRSVVSVHDTRVPTYFVLLDDIEKDGTPYHHEWRMHTHDANSVDVSTNPIDIRNGAARLDIHVIEPPYETLQKSVTPFVNDTDDPDASVLSLSLTDTSPHFALLMLPGDNSVRKPVVSQSDYPWGYEVTLDWGKGYTDMFARNQSGHSVSIPGTVPVTTDAEIVLARVRLGKLQRYLLTNVTTFRYETADYVTVTNGPLTCAMSGGDIQIDRYSADFEFYAPGITDVYYRDLPVPVVYQDGYLTRDPSVGVGEPPGQPHVIRAAAYPNPLNPSTTLRLELDRRADVQAVVYDVGGSPVRTLWRGELPAGSTELEWDGADDAGLRVASGVYFVKMDSRGLSTTLKLVVVK